MSNEKSVHVLVIIVNVDNMHGEKTEKKIVRAFGCRGYGDDLIQ